MCRCDVNVVFMDMFRTHDDFNHILCDKVSDMSIDKRDVGSTFRDRLADLARRYDGNQAAFARAIGLDRSALRQLLMPGSTRLPRAETLCRIAERHSVSLDWLLGLSQSDSASTEISTTLEIEEAADDRDDTRLNEWHREAIGYKIRYVPKTLPDPLRLQEDCSSVADPVAPHHLHVQTVVRATSSGGLGDHQGIGVLEQLAVGRHTPSGLEGLFDGSPSG